MRKFSVIIPVRTVNEYLKENIRHLKKLDYENFEVLIVTDAPEKYDFGGDSRFIMMSSGKAGPAEKRNLAARGAQGDILAFLDDDAYPNRDWLKLADVIFEKNDIYALGAPAVTPADATLKEQASGRVLESYLTSGFTIYRHVPSKKRFINDYPTVNLFIKKEVFLSVGGFHTEFWPGEDTKICLDLLSKYQEEFLYDPRPLVYHHRRELFMPHLKQISRYGKHRGQFARIFPENSRIISYFIPSFFVTGILLGPFVCVVIPPLWPFYISAISLYFYLLVFETYSVYKVDKSPAIAVLFALGTFLTHLTYGVNFMVGLLIRPRLKLRDVDSKTGNYLGG